MAPRRVGRPNFVLRRLGVVAVLAIAGLVIGLTLSELTEPANGGLRATGARPATPTPSPANPSPSASATPTPSPRSTVATFHGLAGMPPVLHHDIYAAAGRGDLSAAARAARPLIYVPNSESNTVDVIDPKTFRIVEHFPVGALPQHVVPSWDMRTLYVANDDGNSLTAIDPRTGHVERTIPVEDPYNMYFTPNGKFAIVVAERLHRLDFRDPHTFHLVHSLDVPQCAGVDHMDFSANGLFFVASCEFSSRLIKVNVEHQRVVGELDLQPGDMPQDVKTSPDGSVFYVADMRAGGVHVISARTFREIGFIATGAGAHGLYPSRAAKFLYVSNRDAGSISVISFATRRVVKTWPIPGGGSPDMGGVSASGRVLWLSGRYSGVVYAIDVRHWKLLARIPVGAGPHGLCVWPQPGRYSLGHTGVTR